MSKLAYDPKTVCAHYIRGGNDKCRFGDKCKKVHLPLDVFFKHATMSHNLEARGGDPTKIGTDDTNFALTRQQQLDAEKRIRQTPGFERFEAKNMHLWDDQERIEAEKAHIDEMLAEQVAIEAEQDEFARADAEHTEEIQADAEKFFAEQEQNELIEVLTAAFKVAPQTPKKPSWAAVVKEAPGAPKKSTVVSTTIDYSPFPKIENWGDAD